MLHKTIFNLSSFFLLTLISSGCGCNQRIAVNNQTETILKVQLALPHPSYELHVGHACHYEFLLNPGQMWNSENASQDDETLFHMWPNGPTVIRVLDPGFDSEWTTFNADLEYPLTVLLTKSGDSIAAAGISGGTSEALQQSDFEWFKSD